MPTNPLKLRMADKDDMPNLLSLIQKLYPAMGWTEEFMQWQYFDNPAGEAKVWMCFDGSKAVASVTAIPHSIFDHQRQTKGFRIQDVLTDPSYQGRSIYRKLSDMCYEYLDTNTNMVHFTFPNEQSDRVFRSSSWKPIANIPLWVDNMGTSPVGLSMKPHFDRLGKFSAEEEKVWQCFRRKGLSGIDKNVDYLNWRYFQNPRSEYSAYRLDRLEMSAVFVLKFYVLENGASVVHICDLFYSKFNEKLIDDVLATVRAEALSIKASSISTWVPECDELVPLLTAAGYMFSPISSRSYFLRGSAEDSIVISQDWNLRMGDSDVY